MKNEFARTHIAGISHCAEFDPAEIGAALDRILRSDTFARSERSRELLQYVIERDLEGEADRLKGFSIALDVFDREDSFDPSTDAVVRVQAGRLRDLLATYYAGEGAEDGIRISIPRGSYVPAYERQCARAVSHAPNGRDAGQDAGQDAGIDAADRADTGDAASAVAMDSAEAPRRAVSVDRRVFALGLALAVCLLAGNLWMLFTMNGIGRDETVRTVSIATAGITAHATSTQSGYLPSVSIQTDVEPALKAALEDAIPRYGSVVYISNDVASAVEPHSDFTLRVIPAGENSVNLQLHDRESGILIGTDQVPGGIDADAMDEHVSRITSRFLPVGGVIYAFLETEERLNPLTQCLVLSSAYFNTQSEARHLAAYGCFENLLESGVNSALAQANLASLTVETITDGYAYPANATLADAIIFGRRAVELAPGSAGAHRSLARALQVSGETDAALTLVREANALNPYDLGIAASYAGTLIAVGDFAKAVTVMESATKAAPVHPSWWDFWTFIAAFHEGRNDLVALSTRNLVGHNRSHYRAARLIAADLEGDEALREKMLQRLERNHDPYFRDPRAYYERIMPADAADRMVAALRKAGFRVSVANGG